jgi:Trk K+ transport system NAD-binding subunit
MMLARKRRPTPPWLRRRIRDVRDTVILLREFRWPLIALAATVVIGGTAYYYISEAYHEIPPGGLIGSWFAVLSMIFLQANLNFPDTAALQVFFFIMPAIGLAILSYGIADFGALLFNRQLRGEAWQVAVADTYHNHVVLVGLGHLGFRVAGALHDLDVPFVCIQLDPTAALVSAVSEWRVPIVSGDALKKDVLRRAGIERAATLVVATSNDMMNLQIAIQARSIKPDIRTVVRLFDDDFAREMCRAFGITSAFSASALAAPAFAAAAADIDVVQQVAVDGQVLTMSSIMLVPQSPLIGRSIGQVEGDYDLSIVLQRRGRNADLHPDGAKTLAAGDELTIFADVPTLQRLKKLAEGK